MKFVAKQILEENSYKTKFNEELHCKNEFQSIDILASPNKNLDRQDFVIECKGAKTDSALILIKEPESRLVGSHNYSNFNISGTKAELVQGAPFSSFEQLDKLREQQTIRQSRERLLLAEIKSLFFEKQEAFFRDIKPVYTLSENPEFLQRLSQQCQDFHLNPEHTEPMNDNFMSRLRAQAVQSKACKKLTPMLFTPELAITSCLKSVLSDAIFGLDENLLQHNLI